MTGRKPEGQIAAEHAIDALMDTLAGIPGYDPTIATDRAAGTITITTTAPKAPTGPPKALAGPTAPVGPTGTHRGWDLVLRWEGQPGALECRTVECRCGWEQQLPDPTEDAAIGAWQRHLDDRTH